MTASSAFTPCCAVTDQTSEPISDFAAPPAVSLLALLVTMQKLPRPRGSALNIGNIEILEGKTSAHCKLQNDQIWSFSRTSSDIVAKNFIERRRTESFGLGTEKKRWYDELNLDD